MSRVYGWSSLGVAHYGHRDAVIPSPIECIPSIGYFEGASGKKDSTSWKTIVIIIGLLGIAIHLMVDARHIREGGDRAPNCTVPENDTFPVSPTLWAIGTSASSTATTHKGSVGLMRSLAELGLYNFAGQDHPISTSNPAHLSPHLLPFFIIRCAEMTPFFVH